MKKLELLLLFVMLNFIGYSQDITNKVGENGNFKVTSPGQTDELIRFIITSDGHIGFNTLFDDVPLTSSFHLIGSLATTVRTLTDTNAYIIRPSDHVCIIKLPESGDDVDILLPLAVNFKGREIILKRDAGGNNRSVNILTSNNGLIDGSSTGYVLTREFSAIKVVSNGEQWWITSEEVGTSATLYSTSFTPEETDDLIGVSFIEDDQVIDLSLPPASDLDGKRYEIKRNADGQIFDNNTLRIIPTSGENLDQHTNAAPYLMNNNWEVITIQSMGGMWLILGNYGH